jgi:hypothetical protein
VEALVIASAEGLASFLVPSFDEPEDHAMYRNERAEGWHTGWPDDRNIRRTRDRIGSPGEERWEKSVRGKSLDRTMSERAFSSHDIGSEWVLEDDQDRGIREQKERRRHVFLECVGERPGLRG